MVKRLVLILAALALVLGPVASEAATITLRPGSSLSGTPGSTIGWGFEVSGDPTLDLAFEFDFQVEITSPDLSSPSVFVFTYPIVLAGTGPLVVDYDAINLMGLFELTLDPTLLPGAQVQGHAFGSYLLTDPLGQVAELRETFDLAFTADVVAPAAAVPEPASLLLCGSGLAVAAARRWRRGRRQE